MRRTVPSLASGNVDAETEVAQMGDQGEIISDEDSVTIEPVEASVAPREPRSSGPAPLSPGAPAPSKPRPERPSLAQSRRLGLGPAYRGPLPEAIRQERANRAEGVERVPDDIRTELRAAFGVDVDAVRRAPEVTEEARRLGAQAYARGGEAYIPAEAGPLDQPRGKAIAGHELTHVAQHRRTGGLLPPEDTPAGQALENEAQAAERFFRGDAGAARPGATAPGGDEDGNAGDEIDEARALMRRLVSEGFAVADGRGGIVFNPPPGLSTTASTPGVQRQTVPAPAHAAPTAPPADFDRLGAFGHAISEDIAGFTQDILVSDFGLSQDIQSQLAADRKDRENEYTNLRQRDYSAERFRDLRLEHRRNQFAAEHQGQAPSDDDRRAIERAVQAEADARLEELDKRVNARLAAINDARRAEAQPGGAPAQTQTLDASLYAKVVGRLFGTPDGPMPADDQSEIDAAATAARAGMDPGTAGPGGGTSPRPETVTRAGGPPTGGPSQATAETARHQPTVGEGFRNIGRSIGSDLLAFSTEAWGVHLTDEERREALGEQPAAAGSAGAPAGPPPGGPTGSGHAATAAAGAAAGLAVSHDVHGSHEIGARAAGQATFSASGHEHLDLEHLDLDELSSRIYDRLRRRLRMELLIDRERAGLLADFR